MGTALRNNAKSCPTKRHYDTAEEAAAMAERRAARIGEPLRAYICKACGGHAIGHPRGWRAKARRDQWLVIRGQWPSPAPEIGPDHRSSTNVTMQGEEATFDDVTEFTPVFEDGTYFLTVVRIEATDGQYGPGLKWVFNMTNKATGQQVKTPGGGALTASGYAEPYEFFQFSSKKVTPRTKVYPWLTAFLGRTPTIGESGSGLVQAVKGKSAEAMIGVPADDIGGRQKILTIKALAPATRSAPAPVQPQAPVYTSHGDPIEPEYDEESDLLARLEAARTKKGAANRAKAGVSDATYEELFVEQLPI